MLRWWLLFFSSLTGLYICWQFGMAEKLIAADQSYLGFASIGVYVMASLRAGWLQRRYDKGEDVAASLPFMWMTSEFLLALGLMGTLVGFMIGGAGFADLSLDDLAKTQKVLGQMAVGMSTAVVTTLVGLVTSVLLKYQLVNME